MHLLVGLLVVLVRLRRRLLVMVRLVVVVRWRPRCRWVQASLLRRDLESPGRASPAALLLSRRVASHCAKATRRASSSDKSSG